MKHTIKNYHQSDVYLEKVNKLYKLREITIIRNEKQDITANPANCEEKILQTTLCQLIGKQINLEMYQLLEKQNLTERIENLNGTKTVKEIKSIMETLPSKDGERCDKYIPAKCQSQLTGRGHLRIHGRIFNLLYI